MTFSEPPSATRLAMKAARKGLRECRTAYCCCRISDQLDVVLLVADYSEKHLMPVLWSEPVWRSLRVFGITDYQGG
jgi:hypothetical protein